MKQSGFVSAEFAISLPLLIFLLFALGQMTYKIFSIAKNQAADYVLQNEIQNVLEEISADAKAAHSVEIKQAVGGSELQEIFFNYRVVGNEEDENLFKNSSKNNFTTSTPEILNLIYTHRFTVGNTSKSGYCIYAERQKSGAKVNPITGGNFFGETSVAKLKFSQPKEKILHIEIEMKSFVTEKKIKAVTSVFMPACEKVEIKS